MTPGMRMLAGMTRQSKMRPAFNALHATTLDLHTTAADLAAALRAADAVPDRHRLSEGAVYTSACRRYLMLTGDDWKATQQPTDATTWASSDHRYRWRDGIAACSCGATAPAPDPQTGLDWHHHHTPAKC